MRRLVIGIIALVITFAMAAPANACSCFNESLREELADADAAFVGTLISVTPAPLGFVGLGRPLARFQVEKAIKGRLTAEIDVDTWINSSCAVELKVGERGGLLLHGEGDQWSSSLCSQVDPDALVQAAAPLPAPNGQGPLTFLVAGKFTESSTLGVDSNAALLAYGEGEEPAEDFSVCPGSNVAVERRGRALFLRDLRTFRSKPTDAQPQIADSESIDGIACSGADASELLVVIADRSASLIKTRIVALRGTSASQMFEELGPYIVFDMPRRLVYAGDDLLRRINLVDGSAENLGPIPTAWDAPLVNSNGTRLAYLKDHGHSAGIEIVAVDLTASPVRVRSIRQPWAWGSLMWSKDFLVFAETEQGQGDPSTRVRFYDPELRQVGQFDGWGASLNVLEDDVLYGIRGGSLISRPLLNGPTQRLRAFEGDRIHAFAMVPEPRPAISDEARGRLPSSGQPVTGAVVPRQADRPNYWPWALGLGAVALGGLLFILARRRSQ
jgi:hypothetical protein